MESRRFVYNLRSDTEPSRHYVGLTSDVDRRLSWHNTGPSGVTVRHRPWSMVVAIEFTDASAVAVADSSSPLPAGEAKHALA
jgi:predicted GIY-YIG superfamily endonuclease